MKLQISIYELLELIDKAIDYNLNDNGIASSLDIDIYHVDGDVYALDHYGNIDRLGRKIKILG